MSLKRFFLPIIFLCLLVTGLFIYKDYGVSFDEPAQRLIGVTNLKHVATKFNINSILANQSFNEFPNSLDKITDRDYGVIFELPAAYLEHLFQLQDERDIYQMRHLFTYLFFCIGVLAFCQIILRRFNSYWFALLGTIFLILSPRIFADAFYNDKDLVFLSVFILATNTSIVFLLSPSLRTAILHGIACAIAIDTRIMAVIIPALTLLIFTTQILRGHIQITAAFRVIFFYLCATIVFTVVLWPYLWSDPYNNFIQAFKNMSKFRHVYTIMFMGNPIETSKLPWYFVPQWILISTPLIYIALFTLGFLIIFYRILINRIILWRSNQDLQDLVFFLLFLGPLIAVILFKSVLYNGWRHLYFIYPLFLLIALVGLHTLWVTLKGRNFLRSLLCILIFIFSSHTAYWMAVHHPLQNLYFNRLAGDWNKSYEVDYWGLANKTALDLMLRDADQAPFSAWPGHGYQWPGSWQLPFIHNLKILSSEDKSRVKLIDDRDKADYVITSMQSRDGNNSDSFLQNYKYHKIGEILIDATPVHYIFKKIPNAKLPEISSNTILKFSKYQIGLNYLGTGWSEPESWGIWSSGRQSTLFFPISDDRRPSKIIFNVRALISDLSPNQDFSIFINGNKYSSFKLSNENSNTFSIPIPEKIQFLDIKLVFISPKRPADLGINNDSRELSIGLQSIEFK